MTGKATQGDTGDQDFINSTSNDSGIHHSLETDDEEHLERYSSHISSDLDPGVYPCHKQMKRMNDVENLELSSNQQLKRGETGFEYSVSNGDEMKTPKLNDRKSFDSLLGEELDVIEELETQSTEESHDFLVRQKEETREFSERKDSEEPFDFLAEQDSEESPNPLVRQILNRVYNTDFENDQPTLEFDDDFETGLEQLPKTSSSAKHKIVIRDLSFEEKQEIHRIDWLAPVFLAVTEDDEEDDDGALKNMRRKAMSIEDLCSVIDTKDEGEIHLSIAYIADASKLIEKYFLDLRNIS